MKREEKEELIIDFLEGNLSEERQQRFQELVASGAIQKEEVERLREVLQALDSLPLPEPGPGLHSRFSAMLSSRIEEEERARLKQPFLWKALKELFTPARLAFALVLFAGGFFSASLLSPQPKENDVEMLASELRQVKQMLFTALIAQPAAGDRLKAVNISSNMAEVDEMVTGALLNSLNNDPNVNVRLAAIEALRKHAAARPEVREKLILSLNSQESPLVQIALAELMLALQDKNALPELRKLMENESTNELVKDKIKQSIHILL
jgi:hypothetical protein